jgi:uncharacterized protein YndB with AHSA1/START domain
MEKLFVKRSIEIDAPVTAVWDVLTEQEYTKQWIEEGWGKEGIEEMIISSNWKLGSEVLWKNKSGSILVNGNVTALNPYKLLRFTVFDAAAQTEFLVTPEDGITYELLEQEASTIFKVRQGDFSVMNNGDRYFETTTRIWERVLPKVKSLAEANKEVEVSTCGKGLAINAALPARFSDVIDSMAENLELHMATLDLTDPRAKLEYAAYQGLAEAYRNIASNLMTTAVKMYSYHDLPMAAHDEKKLSRPEITAAFVRFMKLKESLDILLRKQINADKEILSQSPSQ